MIQFGQTLKAAREAKGLTVQQVAETTKLMSSVIEGLEREDFSRIAVPIYGRGFVKLYCEAVGLEPKPMVEEFMRLYTGRHEEKKETPPPKPPASEQNESATTPASESKARSFAPSYAKHDPQPECPLWAKQLLAHKESLLRFGALGLGAIILLVLLIVGIRSLYRATTATEAETPTPTATTSVTTTAAPRTPQAIDPLYMD